MTLFPEMEDEFEIPYVAEAFPPASNLNGKGILRVTWSDLLWAAVTVGRPNRQSVFHDGVHSGFEALFRWSLLRMALQSVDYDRRLHRTMAAKTLDPSEKGAVSYFLGMTICKLFANHFLDTPWLIHLDAFRPQLDLELSSSRRPDLIGQRPDSEWIGFECKGRVSWPDKKTRDSAKEQATRLVSIGGKRPVFNVAAVTFFRSETLRFYWQDPKPVDEGGIPDIDSDDDFWEHYYRPVYEYVSTLSESDTAIRVNLTSEPNSVSIEKSIQTILSDGLWSLARRTCLRMKEDLLEQGYYPDGLRIIAGPRFDINRENDG